MTDQAKPFRTLHTPDVCFVDVDCGPHHEKPLAALQRFTDGNPEFGFTIYETAGGLRYLLTSRLMIPAVEETIWMFAQLGADLEYVRMCMVNSLFAARLDPKPHRVKRGVEHSTTRLIGRKGQVRQHPDCIEIAEFHDKETFATSRRQLA